MIGGERIKQIIIRLDDDLHRNLKLLTVKKDTTIQKVVEDFLKEYVKQNQVKEK